MPLVKPEKPVFYHTPKNGFLVDDSQKYKMPICAIIMTKLIIQYLITAVFNYLL